MRVPVYPQDLIRNRGFKSLSKQLQEQWHGSTSISLADAQKSARPGLGLQELLRSQRDLKGPANLVNLCRQKPMSDRQLVQPSKLPCSPETQLNLERLVNDLPLTNLVAFKRVQGFSRLRDRALFACMLGALRSSEILSARMHYGVAVYGVKPRDTKNVLDTIPDRHRSLFKQYIKSSKLSDGDYLFRAPNVPGRSTIVKCADEDLFLLGSQGEY
ncbi:hypothetical protein L1887_40663 [Cichorium endivia]|nr:hypothetical protein L1887_40663 [Cichorium endivia]